MRSLLDPDWFVEFDSVVAAADTGGLVEGDSPAVLDRAGLEVVACELAVGAVPPEDSMVSTFLSLAQPATRSPRNVSKIACLRISVPPLNVAPRS
jgi:hypothetical protein